MDFCSVVSMCDWSALAIHWGMCWSSWREEYLGITWTWPKQWERGSTMRSISKEPSTIQSEITWRTEFWNKHTQVTLKGHQGNSIGRPTEKSMAEGMSFVYLLDKGTSRCLFRAHETVGLGVPALFLRFMGLIFFDPFNPSCMLVRVSSNFFLVLLLSVLLTFFFMFLTWNSNVG